jgi:hypothetical protein
MTPEDEKNLIKDYAGGASQSDLEKKYHTGHKTIRRLLSENKTPIREKGGTQSTP